MKPILICLALLAPLSVAHAATITVTRTDDPAPDGCLPSDCSLREAVLAANATVAHDTIVLRSQTYTLTRATDGYPPYHGLVGPLRVETAMTLAGIHSSRTRIRWASSLPWHHTVLEFANPNAGGTELTLSQLTVSHGRAGCIWSGSRTDLPPSRLVIDRSVIELCEGAYGAAARMHGTSLSLRGAVIRGNQALHDGGAFRFSGSVDVDSAGSEISGNQAGWYGGAISLQGDAMWQMYTKVVWVDDGTSVVRDNAAGAAGGAVALYNASTLDISTVEGTPLGQLMTFSENYTDGSGGAFYLRTQAMDHPDDSNRLQRLRIVDNVALVDGGGLRVSGKLHGSDLEIAGNAASTGNGGGIALAEGNAHTRVLERISLHDNHARQGGGGALYATCQSIELRDASVFANRAAASRGQAIETSANATLSHVTVSGHQTASAPSPALHKTMSMACPTAAIRYGNSLLLDACSASSTWQLVSDGGNQFGPAASACPAQSRIDRRQSDASVFRLEVGPFGGDFDVTGWTAGLSSPPQRDWGQGAHCTASDVRGKARDVGRCDAGAFEQ